MSQTVDFKGRSVLITGACGTVGAELTKQVVAAGADRVVCVDNNESELFFLQQTHKDHFHVNCYLADIRDLEALKQRMQGIDVVLHSAALKHVGLCEDSPTQAVRTNIEGTQNIIDAALANGVDRVIFTSSDKAVNPTNVMGTSKLMGERLMTAASLNNRNSKAVFASTRFGNVLGSRGSVVPLFQRQIEQGGPVTLTDREMTRFIMTLEEAVGLVLQSAMIATGGEVFVTKMPVARIEDIATHMVSTLAGGKDIQITEIGAKPGEKMYEELMNDEEVRRTYEIEDFFVVLPAFAGNHEDQYPLVKGRQKADRPYNSAVEKGMTAQDVADYFDSRGILR
ncbi:SDR family NAD(P)-dependent oxidoreductase [Sulfitobacter geojensis]|uniref:SDR family NAD(P)-dependent oxidoreductase n=1 Tax=Sulfitobacter geojensis TaxID=1342299 RepID=UPI000469F3BE|nr:SDR family NAD(P)-dependent oxidoreductase [Sulfitobacter geojensis]NYI27459.1 FlaA1/EpsC-like NDP-sugar epimerase [Sulfitobacter geojensis]